jgi:hypothetical protein
MKSSGQLLSLAGIILAVYSLFFMDVSVEVGDGTRVNNIGLMAQQQNYLLVAVSFSCWYLHFILREKEVITRGRFH